MKLLREVAKKVEGEEEQEVSSSTAVVPEGGWNVGHLANHGIILSCDGFSMKLDIDQLNVLFDLAEDGDIGEVRDHQGKVVAVEVLDDGIVLSRDDDEAYPNGVKLDLDTLKEMGIEEHEDAAGETPGEEPAEEDGPEEEPSEEESDDTIDPETVEEGVKPAFRRAGKKIKRGFRVTSGFRKGRVVSNMKNAFKPRAKASTRLKLKIASKKKKLVRILKSKRTRKRPLSKRLRRLNKT